jgi:hypothetical protein
MEALFDFFQDILPRIISLATFLSKGMATKTSLLKTDMSQAEEGTLEGA